MTRYDFFEGDGDRSRLFEAAVAASLVLHAAFFLAVNRVRPGEVFLPDPIEIDLTKPPGGPAKRGAPRRLVPGALPVPSVPAEAVVPKPPEEKPVPPTDWTLKGPETRKVEQVQAPAPPPGGVVDGKGTASIPGGHGPGADEGDPNGKGPGGGGDIVSYPRLLNRDEIFGMLKRFYPEGERRAGHEGTVVLAVHVGADGRVSGTEVLESAGSAFDRAAGEVAKLMRFEPAMGRKGPVAVKLPQSVVFQLEDD